MDYSVAVGDGVSRGDDTGVQLGKITAKAVVLLALAATYQDYRGDNVGKITTLVTIPEFKRKWMQTSIKIYISHKNERKA